ncbi:SDR family oxidoreductase [Pseudomonas atacamensis]|uniref:UDP-glucose 4-epimerase family protein n=1 Tax=Pseudomonas atacamensis TaxID=2565368 RepID=UPI00320B2B8C
MTLKVLVTGANGFVGGALLSRLEVDEAFTPIAAVRDVKGFDGVCQVRSFDLCDSVSLPSMKDVDVVIHSAARVHVMNETAVDALYEFRRANLEGTLRLARRASEEGVKRFVFISSIKVNGESTQANCPFNADDNPEPADPYSISKFEAELALREICHSAEMELVIIRPPLVYGPGVKANFLSMLKWLDKGVPLPFGALHNQRSLIAIGNLVDLIIICACHPAARDQVFLASDGSDLSTTQLLEELANAMNKKARLVAVPVYLLAALGWLLRKQDVVQRICGSLQVDIRKNKELLGWTPPIDRKAAFRETIIHYMKGKA